eukprot:4250577-Alexandrium_andersonii.AAC.1
MSASLVGSEMCIRDRCDASGGAPAGKRARELVSVGGFSEKKLRRGVRRPPDARACPEASV